MLPLGPQKSLIVASNRLPFVLERDASGEWRIEPGSGGLVTALVPVLRDRGGIWIGWPGSVESDEGDIEQILERATRRSPYQVRPVPLTEEERDNFYYGFSNEIIWPLFHDFQTLCTFDPEYWKAYEAVNRKFARVIAAASRPDDLIWVHDYHLMSVACELRCLGISSRMGFFLHIPFPPVDLYVKLPWRLAILSALLDYDLIGFQAQRDRRNFIHCLRALVKNVKIEGRGRVLTALVGDRKVRLGVFPISMDFQAFARDAASEDVTRRCQQLRADLPDRQLILGVDRLDYTKGIPDKLKEFRHALIRFPELRERVTLVQVVVPSREEIPEYYDLKTEIEQLVGRINGEFTQPGWIPIQYVYRSWERNELLAYYRAAEIALVTPLKDGMNLVAKEYCACRIDESGVLILSEFAGAASQLAEGALLVNPYDVYRVSDAIYRAFTMSAEERRSRMRKLRSTIARYDIFWWVDAFLKAEVGLDTSERVSG
ncbi:MAG: trehalose-6-phosphate synthase [Gemmatimonadetes bacterium]|nr:trehalose-6-phosphate synthase [Gemmatimonadota bacterium]